MGRSRCCPPALRTRPGGSCELSWPVALTAVRAIEGFHRLFRPQVEPVVTAYSAGLLAFSQTLDLSAIRNDIGWTPKVEFAEGLRRTFAGDQAA